MQKVIGWLMSDGGHTRENAEELAARNKDFIRRCLADGWSERETAERVSRIENPRPAKREEFA